MRNLYLIEDSERQWVSAESEDDAVRELAALYGSTPEKYRSECEPTVTLIPPDEVVRVYTEEPFREPSAYVEKTAAEWAASRAGMVASTCV